MKISLFKKWLSYIMEVPVTQLPSAYSGRLDLIISRGRYQLSTAHAIYSFGDKYQNFREVFESCNLGNPPVKNVLLLGLGMGSIPLMLEKIFNQSLHYTAVEIDEAVIFLASRYTLDELESPVSIIQADAEAFVYQSDETFDLICMDVFIDDQIPDSMQSVEFARALRKRLTPAGFVITNHLGLHKQDKAKATRYYTEIFKAVFPDAGYMMADNNMMMVSDGSRIKSGSAYML
jgi:spermidine synthase